MKCGVSAWVFEHVVVLLVPVELEFFAVVHKDFCLLGGSCSVRVFRLWVLVVVCRLDGFGFVFSSSGWRRLALFSQLQPDGNAARQVLRQRLRARGCFCGDPCIVYFPKKDAENLFCCANCWPVSRLLSVGVSESRAHSLLSWFFMATIGLVGAKTKVMLDVKRSYLRQAHSSCRVQPLVHVEQQLSCHAVIGVGSFVGKDVGAVLLAAYDSKAVADVL